MHTRIARRMSLPFWILLAAFAAFTIFPSASIAQTQIVSGVDYANNYPNVAALTGLKAGWLGPGSSAISCSGSLLHVDDDKIVILTAAHCTDPWIYNIGTGWLESVGVSFEVDNVVNGYFNDGTYYLRGGVPISFPARNSPFDANDYGMVVFPRNAANTEDDTFDDLYPTGIQPIELPPSHTYVRNLIQATPLPQLNLEFAAVGYGIGPKIGRFNDVSTFKKREVARLTFNSWNPGNDILRSSMNANFGEDITCNGDSGGPLFYEDATLGRIQVSLVSGGDIACRETNTGPGFGTEITFDFLDCALVQGDADEVRSCVLNLFQ